MTTGPVAAYDGVILRLDFLTHPMQPPSEATPGLNHILSRKQALELIEMLTSAVQRLGSGASQGAGLPKH
jgi:hypothetical protein